MIWATVAGTGTPCICGHGVDLHRLLDASIGEVDEEDEVVVEWEVTCEGVWFPQRGRGGSVHCRCLGFQEVNTE